MNSTTMDPGSLDYAIFDTQDYVNIILQRSDVLSDLPGSGKLIKRWTQGDPEPLQAIARDRGALLGQRAMRDIAREFDALRATLETLCPRSIADIGCGYGFFDLIAARELGADLHLIDLEQNAHTHFGFNAEGSAYSNLQKALGFLTSNGVPAEKITATNPEKEDVSGIGPVDLAVSFLACGFHFPVDVYMGFFASNVSADGHIILDLRNARRDRQIETLSTLGRVDILSQSNNRARVLVSKGVWT